MKLIKVFSLKKKLLVTFLLLWLMTVVIATLAAYWFSGSAAQVSFDRVLKDDALALAAQVKWEPSGPRFGVDTNTADFLIFDSLYQSKFIVLNKYGRRIAGNAELVVPVSTDITKVKESFFFDLPDSQGDLRVVALRVNHQIDKEWVWVLVGESHTKRNQISHELAAAIFLPAIGLAFFIVPLLLFGIRLSLASTIEISEAVSRKGINDLLPLSLESVPDELKVVILHINDLLERLKASIIHERRFISDAAHQLRTPIAGIKLLIEDLARTHDANPNQPPDSEVLQELIAASSRAAHLVRQLLSLARTDTRTVEQLEKFSLRNLIIEIAEKWQQPVVASHKKLIFGLGISKVYEIELTGNILLVEEAIGNIIDNAINYGGDEIKIDANLSERALTLSIHDNATEVTSDMVDAMLTPFWRGEHEVSVGVGLGLPIAQKAMRQIGGDLLIKCRPEVVGTAVLITLPLG